MGNWYVSLMTGFANSSSLPRLTIADIFEL